ncbi:MAG: glycosyltransferase family 4 protein [Gammaproteobacteria bacterium]|nr:glycosyltransferase family 4 protein [Gammaproteobacteria bacterium]
MPESSPTDRPLRIVQVLPALNEGGVERGTVEMARELVLLGHESIVISSGGRMVERLQREGTRHIEMPVHRKSLLSLRQVKPMRKLLAELRPDIVHVRSRIPAWIVWLAWRSMPPQSRPRLVSTFHGLYSVNQYSAIMAKAEHLIAISDCVNQYILDHYKVPPGKITRIFRGLDPGAFHRDACTPEWKSQLFRHYPELKDKRLILMPGRLSRWKGQEAFLDMMAKLVQIRPDCHGLVVGDAEPSKQHYLQELRDQCRQKGLDQHVTFVGHRSDIPAFYALADITCHMSNKAEPFGRTVPEALACGCKVVAFNRGGASESLQHCFPEGLVEPDNTLAFAQKVAELLDQPAQIQLPAEFFLEHQVNATLAVYRRLLASRP